eukprot:Gregarina_sp_Poly_1__7905@NODE_44_length_17989_cov_118_013391_g38_i0_p3_GENE_NODE_44_length_17989_cov_118_013391_g38_i0NODE_44_length_17989_cov_118_013391_g38_i0_p3_ORF_typecomplete_len374_score31_10NIF/PF03031_18/3_1e26ubiquitin/PF00240_23/8_4e05UN_NPL4/PF11543_8/0_044_NODE_44_length_17989_cov_118_013391_g38_i01199213113
MPPESSLDQNFSAFMPSSATTNDGITTIRCKWRQHIIPILFTHSEFQTANVADLKQIIQEQLDIPCDRQKFLNVCSKQGERVTSDDTLLQDCKFKPTCGADLLLLGTPLAEQLPAEVEEFRALCEDDITFDPIEAQKHVFAFMEDPENAKCIAQKTFKTEICLIRPPRPHKKLLVLDIDYTIYDCKGASKGCPLEELKRPYLNEFLSMINPYFDWVIWSQTRWQWVEAKCTELGLLTTPELGPCFTLDRSSMVVLKFPATLKSFKLVRKSKRDAEVKALQLIWDKKINNWGPSNTLHVDDLPRNFLLNPLNGIPVRPYTKDLHEADKELLLLAHYLQKVSTLDDVTTINHFRWKHFTKTVLNLDEFNVGRRVY